ncbi:MAG: glycoside hydrolase family 3 N-terminal domain-containing protein [Bacteroidota bacterium]
MTSIAQMTLTDKIGQLFLMGFDGIDEATTTTFCEQLSRYCPCGVILFDYDVAHQKPGRNIQSPDQLRSLISMLQSKASVPLLVGIDQEGGAVQRLRTGQGFLESKSHQELGLMNDPERTGQEIQALVHQLKELGITLNFAPVVDIAPLNKASMIGARGRSFGSDAQHVSDHAVAYSRAHLEGGVIPCAKHFPGHGSSADDSHLGFVDVSNTWHPDELQPYRSLIEANLCPMIMSAHIFLSRYDKQLPATLSQSILRGLLRKELNFEGVIISDDIQMKAISDHFSLKETIELGLIAGLDLFCVGNNLSSEHISLQACVERTHELVADGAITEQRIDESVHRILSLKHQVGLV